MAKMVTTLNYFSNKKRKQRTDRLAVMLSFVWLFSYLTNQKIMLSSSRERNFGELVGFEAKATKLKSALHSPVEIASTRKKFIIS